MINHIGEWNHGLSCTRSPTFPEGSQGSLLQAPCLLPYLPHLPGLPHCQEAHCCGGELHQVPGLQWHAQWNLHQQHRSRMWVVMGQWNEWCLKGNFDWLDIQRNSLNGCAYTDPSINYKLLLTISSHPWKLKILFWKMVLPTQMYV